MIVIQQPTPKGSLPQPAGPSVSRAKVEHKIAPALFEQPATPITPSGHGLRKRTMARSASMFQSQLGEHTSSRSSSPLMSDTSLRSSPGLAATSTPASTVLSSGSGSGSGRRTKQSAGPSMETAPSGKGKLPASEDPAALSYDVPVDVAMPAFARPSTNAQRDLGRVWEAVASARRIAVICGAGISVSSPANIPDFRSTHGLFRKLKEKHPNVGLQSGKDLFDASLFNSPATSTLFYSMVSELKAMADAASPTTFHHLLKRLDMEGRLMRVYTQNIDGLEEKAGLTFGLGEAGDSRTTLRALGKRKRNAAGQHGKGGMARSKSDSAVVFGRSQGSDSEVEEPMFPRAIPLHGSLSTMTCQICGHKVYLSLASPGPQRLPHRARELSPDASDQAVSAMDLLSQGEPVACKRCESHEQVRLVAGLRSRGVGMMKVDVVLYNGQNDGAERVGDCVERDILGLRDPNETLVPESQRERMARERKERKEQTVAAKRQEKQAGGGGVALQPIVEMTTADDAFAAAFADEDEADAKSAEEAIGVFTTQPTALSDAANAKPKRQSRLKPLPPDLLIVAGTSLKVPGTKRIVREFAKACQARDYREYPSSDESSEDEAGSRSKARRSRSSTPRTSRSKGKKGNSQEDGSDEEDEEEDPNAPIRTVLLNYDFPLPHGQWDDVFDVWVQGDVQQAALGLWQASKYPTDQAVNEFSMRIEESDELLQAGLSWSAHLDVLEAERKAAKKAATAASKKSSSQGSQSTLQGSQPAKSKGSASLSASQTSQKSAGRGQAKKAATNAKSESAAVKSATAKAKASSKAKTASKAGIDKATASPDKKKARKPASQSAPKAPAVDAGLDKFMKGTKATIARANSTSKVKKVGS